MAGRSVAGGGSLVLDSEGLSKLAASDVRAVAFADEVLKRQGEVVVSALTLAEVLRGGARDALVHRVLSRIAIVPVTTEIGRAAGVLLGASGLSGHRCAIDAVVAATALRQTRPVVLLSSDVDDMTKLVEEPHLAKRERVAVVHV